MSREADRLRWRIEYLLSGSTVANTALIAAAMGLNINVTRRLLDKMVREGVLGKEQTTFWNGMHYAKRNYYWRKKPARSK